MLSPLASEPPKAVSTRPPTMIGGGKARGTGAIPERRWLPLVFAFAVLLRLMAIAPVLVDPERGVRGDSPGYIALAEALAAGNGFTTLVDGEHESCVARTPGYPGFLALIGAGNGLRRTIPLAQALLDLVTLWLVYLTAGRRLGGRAGVIAAAIYAIGVSSAAACALVMTETLFTFLIAVQMYYGVRFVERQRTVDALVSAAALGLAILTRPIGIVLVPLMGVMLVLAVRRARRSWPAAVFAVLTLAVIATPWIERNRRLTGHPMIASIGDFNLAAYNTAALTALVDRLPEGVARARVLATVMPEAAGGRDWSWIPRARRVFTAEVCAHPVAYLALHLRDSLLNLVPDAATLLELWGATEGERGTKEVIHTHGLRAGMRHYLAGRWGWFLIVAPWFLASGLVWAVSGLGAREHWRAGRRGLATLCCLAMALLILSPGPASHPRFGVPALPWAAVCAAGCFARSRGRA